VLRPTVTDISQYIPHALGTAIAALGAGAAWIFKKHDERDDARFRAVGDYLMKVDSKLDTAITRQADNHAELLKTLIDIRRDR